jgi:hypothetical protein
MNICTGRIVADCSEHERQFNNIELASVRTGKFTQNQRMLVLCRGFHGWEMRCWCVTPRRSVVGLYQRFGPRYCLNLQGYLSVTYFYLNHDNKFPCAKSINPQ